MISAIILAAGESKRMGAPKMLLPWGNVTVLEHVISVFAGAGIEDILVITGGAHELVEEAVHEYGSRYPVRSVHNKNYREGEMLSSIQQGLHDLGGKDVGAALIGLGDQPQVQERSVRLVLDKFKATTSPLVVPSFQMRRGHPWLMAESLWAEFAEMDHTKSARDFLNAHAGDIQYVEAGTPSIFADLDTPEEYRASRP